MIDTHLHAWDRTAITYPWLDDHPSLPSRVDLPTADDLRAANLKHAVLIEAGAAPEQRDAELAYLLRLVATHPWIIGVVAGCTWNAPPDDLPAPTAKLLGVRVTLFGVEPSAASAQALAMTLAHAADRGFSVDVLCSPRELSIVAGALNAEPGGRVVIDHLAAPADWASAQTTKWIRGITELARHTPCFFKISGAGLAPGFATTILDAAGTGRCMLGSDWPVTRTGERYAVDLENAIGELAATVDPALSAGTARRFYAVE